MRRFGHRLTIPLFSKRCIHNGLAAPFRLKSTSRQIERQACRGCGFHEKPVWEKWRVRSLGPVLRGDAVRRPPCGVPMAPAAKILRRCGGRAVRTVALVQCFALLGTKMRVFWLDSSLPMLAIACYDCALRLDSNQNPSHFLYPSTRNTALEKLGNTREVTPGFPGLA